MGYRKIKLDCASVCSDARSRGQSCHCANLLIMLILRDKNSVLILCIIVVAVFFLARVVVRTLINFWSSFYKNDTVRFQEIPISVSCCLSEIDHFAWMTCLSTSTRAGRWRAKSRFYALNVGSQSPWDNFFSNCKKEYPRDLVFFFGLSSLSNRS